MSMGIIYTKAYVDALRAALEEALDGWEYAAQYKGEYFVKKHGDTEDIARLRKLLDEDKEAE